MFPPSEILVHVSAPSRGVDDARYRKQLLGFLTFEAVAKPDAAIQSPTSQVVRDGESPPQVANAVGEQQSDMCYRKTGQFAGNELHSSEGRGRVPACTTPFQAAGVASKLSAWKSLRTDWSANTTPISILPNKPFTRSPYVHIEQTPTADRPRTAPTRSSSSQGFPVLRRTQSDSWEPPPSVVPDSQPSHQSLKRRGFSRNSASPTSIQISPSTKRRRRQTSSSPSPKPASPVANDLPHPTPSPLPPPLSTETASPERGLPRCEIHPPREIRPPPPATSTTPFTTHLTPSLQILLTELPLSKHFDPNFIFLRPLQPLERGHWFIPTTSSFPPLIQKDFWSFLKDFVGAGRAGWGVWVARDGDENRQGKGGMDGSGALRVYCWGECVGAIWLVLWVGSKRLIRKCDAQWVDARGKVVVKMR